MSLWSENWRDESLILIYNDFRGVIHRVGFSSKGKPIWVIWNTYQRNAFTVLWARNRPDSYLRQFLDEDNVEIVIDFEYNIDNEIVLLNVLGKNLQVFHNHIALPFIAKQVEFFWLSWILAFL